MMFLLHYIQLSLWTCIYLYQKDKSPIIYDLIIKKINTKSKNKLRNTALIEVLYSCGLRVSELITLKISDLFFDESVIKVTGKGNKERFVPISKEAMKYVNN